MQSRLRGSSYPNPWPPDPTPLLGSFCTCQACGEGTAASPSALCKCFSKSQAVQNQVLHSQARLTALLQGPQSYLYLQVHRREVSLKTATRQQPQLPSHRHPRGVGHCHLSHRQEQSTKLQST